MLLGSLTNFTFTALLDFANAETGIRLMKRQKTISSDRNRTASFFML